MSSEQRQIKDNEKSVAEEVDAEHDLVAEPEQDPGSDDAPDNDSGAEDADESIEHQLDRAQATIKEYWDQIMRLKAEIQNNQKRNARDIENAHKYVLRSFAESLLPIVDSMEMGQQAAEADDASLETIVEGTRLTLELFTQVLEKHGLQQIDPLGEKFDPEQHQAISMVDAEGAKSNTIVSVMQKGYLLNDRLVRPAMVVVAK